MNSYKAGDRIRILETTGTANMWLTDYPQIIGAEATLVIDAEYYKDGWHFVKVQFDPEFQKEIAYTLPHMSMAWAKIELVLPEPKAPKGNKGWVECIEPTPTLKNGWRYLVEFRGKKVRVIRDQHNSTLHYGNIVLARRFKNVEFQKNV